MSSVIDWGKDQVRSFRPWADAIAEWRNTRRRDAEAAKEKKRKEEDERARKSLEENWQKVPLQFARNPLLYDSAESEEQSSSETPQTPKQTTYQDNESIESDVPPKDIPEQQRHDHKNGERVWQEHVRTCLERQRAESGQPKLWDKVQEGFQQTAAGSSAESSQMNAKRAPEEHQHERQMAEWRREVLEEAYRGGRGSGSEARRARARAAVLRR